MAKHLLDIGQTLATRRNCLNSHRATSFFKLFKFKYNYNIFLYITCLKGVTEICVKYLYSHFSKHQSSMRNVLRHQPIIQSITRWKGQKMKAWRLLVVYDGYDSLTKTFYSWRRWRRNYKDVNGNDTEENPQPRDKGRRVIPPELILLPSVISDLASCLIQFPLLPSLGGLLSGEIIERLFWGLLYCACALSLVTRPNFILPFISIVIFICFTRFFPVKLRAFSCFWF